MVLADFNIKIKPVIISLLIIAPALALAGGFTLMWRFFVFLAVVVLASYLWLFFSARSISGRTGRSVDSCHVGDCIEEEHTISYNSRLPCPRIEVTVDTDIPGKHDAAVFTLPRGGEYNWHHSVRCQQRGRYRLGILDIKLTDPLGLLSWRFRMGDTREIIVYPAVFHLPFFDVVPRIESGMGPKRRLVSEVGPSVARVRGYFSGDSLRHIHWRTTAHSGQLMVKEFDPDPSNYAFRDVWIVLDINRNTMMGEGGESADAYMTTVAASLTRKYLDGQKRVGLITSGERPRIFLPDTGEAHLQKLMRSLAVNRTGGEGSLVNMLTSESWLFDANAAVIVIASSDSRGIIEPLRRIAGRESFVSAVLMDSLSFGGEGDAGNIYRALSSAGINVYIVRQGDDVVRALDSRMASRPYHSGDRMQKWIAAI